VKIKLLLLSASCTLLVACGSDSEQVLEQLSGSENFHSEKTQVEQTLSTQMDALEKAKGLEQQMQIDVERRMAEIE